MKYGLAVGLSVESVLFGVFALLSVASALGVVLIRDPIKGALSLIGCFFCLASLFVLLRAEMIAVLEILVYAGAIMVLFVFVLMLVEDKNAALFSPVVGQKVVIPLKAAAVVAVGGGLAAAVWATNLGPSESLAPGFGTPRGVGSVFFRDFVFHFEMTSLLLLGAIVGAVVVSRRAKVRGE